jgi:myo-inositol-1(or 4)-monophosphatase
MVAPQGQEIEQLTQFALELIRRLGDEALSFYGKGKTFLKFDNELVTEAELHLINIFEKEIQSHFPEHQVYKNNHEMDDYKHGDKKFLWIFDALDGVANFQAGIPIWGISVSLLENLWPAYGAFYMPATGDLFYSKGGKKAFLGKKEIFISEQESINDESLFLTYSRFHQHYESNFPGKIRNLGCTTAHACYVAMGRAEGAIVAKESYQNLASVHIIVESAGGKILKMDGSQIHLSDHLDEARIEDHLMIVSPEIFTQIRSALQPKL